mgnify:CR=1 FL=1
MAKSELPNLHFFHFFNKNFAKSQFVINQVHPTFGVMDMESVPLSINISLEMPDEP